MSVLIVGSSELTGRLVVALAEAGVEADGCPLAAAAGESAGALAGALVEIERAVEAKVPTAVIALGPSDAATAAALVAGKAGVPLLSLLDFETDARLGDEARAVAELSARRFELPSDESSLPALAAEIAAALSSS